MEGHRRAIEEAERALLAWALGDVTGHAALAAICGVLSRFDVMWGLLERNAELVVVAGNQREGSDARVLERVAADSPFRAFHRVTDARWPLFVSGSTSASEPRWLACEPIGSTSENAPSSFVVIGFSDAECDEVLVTLPYLARACVPVLARERRTALTVKHLHGARNVLAAVKANVEYASELVRLVREARGPLAPQPSPATFAEHERDLADALDKAEHATREMAAAIEVLGLLAQGRAPS